MSQQQQTQTKKNNSQKPKNTVSKRIDFKSGIPDSLFKQAGGRCSVPRCKNPTMGPYYERMGAVNMGVACHIYSAAENGPRGQGEKNSDFIESEKNGIWCCQYHASLIDKASGYDYPASVLFAWKALAAARVLKQMNGNPSQLGWVESIELSTFSFPEKATKVTLSRCTILWGANRSGKTALMDAAASISHSRYAEPFAGSKKRNAGGISEPVIFSAKITYSTVDILSKELNLEIAGIELIRRDGFVPCLLPPGDLEVIYCSETDRRKHAHEDDIDFMMRALNIDKSALYALAKIGGNTLIPGEIKFEQAMEEDESEGLYLKIKNNGKPYFNLLFKKSQSDCYEHFDSLSGSAQGRLILDLLITKAREISKQRLTLLLIEGLPNNFDLKKFEALLRQLANEEFQVVVSLPPIREKDLILRDAGQSTLQTLDYLHSWRLAIIGSESTHAEERP